MARPWSTGRGADGRPTSHDKGRRGTKRHRRPFLEDNGRVCGKRVTKVTQAIEDIRHLPEKTGSISILVARDEQRNNRELCFASSHPPVCAIQRNLPVVPRREVYPIFSLYGGSAVSAGRPKPQNHKFHSMAGGYRNHESRKT